MLRLLIIYSTVFRYGLDELIADRFRPRWLLVLLRVPFFWRSLARPRGERLRIALESLGPIFVKFGQLLSTRRDLVPPDLADELAKLQDQVPPFASSEVEALLNAAYGKPYREIFSTFDLTPAAAASVAQVHFATLTTGKQAGQEAAVKIIRPGIEHTIEKDVRLLYTAATLVERFFRDGERLRPREVVREFEHTIFDELDLIREAANASQLRRNFEPGTLLYVPEVYWDYCHRNVMVMERIKAIQVNDLANLRANNIDIDKLSRQGVEIFFTQAFRDAFFHADMHPGNIFVLPNGTYTGVDFGIMGTLSEADKNYLAQNFLAFFDRNYRRVAEAHISAGWVPKETRVDEFESAIRSVCEPIFGRPLREIEFGKVLLRLFEVSRRFNMVIQPQLVLLQKTLLQIEGLGRQLNPDLDIVPIAKPILKRWMSEQAGLRALIQSVREEAPLWSKTFPQLPRLAHRIMTDNTTERIEAAVNQLEATQRWQTRVLWFIAFFLALMVAGYLIMALDYFKVI